MNFRIAIKCFLVLQLFICNSASAQKVGLVLSGGGASGLAHVGVIKALEENNIPIDYITGTSIGALLGCMYAVGYSPSMIEEVVKSEKTKNWVYGNIEDKYHYYFKKYEDNNSWVTFKLSLDSVIQVAFPTHIISPIALDFALMENLSPPSAAANYNFDSLFIPFRCVASDIEAKQSVIFKEGNLSEAVRASSSYPFYIKPISVKGKLLFDGGLYNNFPSNVMYDDFFPDFIIGSNVTGNAPPPNEDNILSQVRNMLVSKSNFDAICENGIIVQPYTDVGLFDFDNPQPLIDSGYAAAMRKMPEIKKCLERRSDSLELKQRREDFYQKQPKLVFDNIYIEGLNRVQSNYIRRSLRHKNKIIDIDQLKPAYFRLAADDKIKYIYPQAKYNKASGYYDLYLKIEKEKDIITHFGGYFSNRPISEGYAAFQYNYLGNIGMSIIGNTYFGKLYSSAQIKARIDFSYNIPFYIEPSLTYNRWDFFKSSTAFFEDVKPSYLIQKDEYGEVNIGFPAKNKGKIVAGAGLANLIDKYYQTDQFTQADTTDRTDFGMFTSHIMYESSSLNRKQYANEGSYFNLNARYIQGEEFNQPGSTSINKDPFRKIHEWIQFKFIFDNYFKSRGTLRLGVYAEAVYSTQTLFNNYAATILTAPSFQPIPESKTIFLENYRAHQYVAVGLKSIINFRKNIDLRFEGYAFLPYQAILKNPDLTAVYGSEFATKHYIGTVAAVYHTPVGPLSLSVNYYDKRTQSFSFLFHFGYILFNKKALE